MNEAELRAIYAHAWEAMEAEIRAFFEEYGLEGALDAAAASRPMSERERDAWRRAMLDMRGEDALTETLAEAMSRETATRAEALSLLLRERAALLRADLDAAGILGDANDPLLGLPAKALASAERGLTESGVLALAEGAVNDSQKRRETGAELLGGAKYYVVETVEDERSCCTGMSGLILPAGEAEIGENFPPFHINCRCSVRAEEMGSGELLRVDGTESERTEAEAKAREFMSLIKEYNDRLGNLDDMFIANSVESSRVSEAYREEGRRIAKILEKIDDFWKEHYDLFIEYMKDWMAGLVDAPEEWRMLYFAAKWAQLGKEQFKPENYLDRALLGEEFWEGYEAEKELWRNDLEYYLRHANIPGVRKNIFVSAVLAMRDIYDGAVPSDWLIKGNASEIDKLARIIYAEQSGVLYNQVEVLYVIINRVFDHGNFNQRGIKNISNVIGAYSNGGYEFTPFGKLPEEAQKAPGEENLFWQNAKLLAAYAYVLFGEKARDDLLDDYDRIINKDAKKDERVKVEIKEAYDYYMDILGRMPDVTGVPIGIFANHEVFFSGGSVRVDFRDAKPRPVNALRRNRERRLEFEPE